MNKLLQRLKDGLNEDARYVYADAVTNALLTAQIKALREDRGLTQEQLAELVGTQQSGISRWQNSGYSGCKVDTLRKFARAFGVRLRITFEEFGSLPEDAGEFNKHRLAPRKFEDDPAFNAEALQENSDVARFFRTMDATVSDGLSRILRSHYAIVHESADHVKGMQPHSALTSRPVVSTALERSDRLVPPRTRTVAPPKAGPDSEVDATIKLSLHVIGEEVAA